MTFYTGSFPANIMLAPTYWSRGGFMQRLSTAFFLVLTLTLAVALAGCFGKSTPNSPNGGVQSVSLSPSGNISLEVGATQVFSASATNGSGHSVPVTAQFSVTVPPGASGPSPLSVANNGNACAGAWDPTVSICNPGTPGIAIVTAVVNGVSSPATYVYVHLHIDNLQVSNAEQTQPPFDCFSQNQTWLYQGTAYNNGNDITSSVGPFNWSSTNSGVLLVAPYIPPNQPNVLNQAKVTAESPGITQIFATVSGTASNPLPITTCLVQYLRVRAEGVTGNSITVNSGTAVTLEATAVDTLGYTLTKPPLTWSTNNPEVVEFSSLTSTTGTNTATTRSNLGGADITASCSPPTCNIGISGSQNAQGQILPALPIYASNGILPNGLPPGFGTISVNLTTTNKPPTFLGWAATNLCGTVPGCTSTMFQITPGTTSNPITATAIVPRTPNSMLFNHQTRIYMGSDQGLMYIDTGSASAKVNEVSSALTPCNVIVCGTLLAISNDGKQVVVSDDVSTTPQVYIYNSGASGSTNPVTDLILSGTGGQNSPDVASAAAFSPDQSKIFILTNAANMYVYSTVDAFAPVQVPVASTCNNNGVVECDVAFSADSSFAYVASSTSGVGSISAFSACALPGVPSPEVGTPVTLSGIPLRIFPSPNLPPVNPQSSGPTTQTLYVLEPPAIQVVTAEFSQTPIVDGQFTCNPPSVSFTAGPTYNLGQGAFSPVYARLVGNGSQMIIVAQNVPAVLVFNSVNGTTSAVPLVNNANPLSASSSSDGSQVYVAACDQYPNNDRSLPCSAGSVHVVNTVSLGDYQQVPFINYNTNNMCNNLGPGAPLCVANLVAIKPQ